MLYREGVFVLLKVNCMGDAQIVSSWPSLDSHPPPAKVSMGASPSQDVSVEGGRFGDLIQVLLLDWQTPEQVISLLFCDSFPSLQNVSPPLRR